jgi:hypothetical protein
VSFRASAGRRRLRLLVLGTAAVATLAAAGCGEKDEPPIRPPTTAPAATTPTAPAPPGATTTAPPNAPTAPVPKTTP